MAFLEYTNNGLPYWLNQYVSDRRIIVGEYTDFDTRIHFGLWQPQEQIQIGSYQKSLPI